MPTLPQHTPSERRFDRQAVRAAAAARFARQSARWSLDEDATAEIDALMLGVAGGRRINPSFDL